MKLISGRKKIVRVIKYLSLVFVSSFLFSGMAMSQCIDIGPAIPPICQGGTTIAL